MLNFSDDFFKREIKWGFPVGELRKRAWAAQLEILNRIINICDKYQLTWYVYWGTLIGAVRHKGFIPWDDDIDIALKRDDYIKLLEVAKEELPQEYGIINSYTDSEPEWKDCPRWKNSFSRIVNNRTMIDLSLSGMRKFHGFPFRAGVDIFPLYYVPSDKMQAGQQKQLLAMIWQIFGIIDYQDLHEEEEDPQELQEITESVEGAIELIEQWTGFKLDRNKHYYNQLQVLYDQIGRWYSAEEAEGVTVFPQYVSHGYEVEPELLEESICLPFENITVKAPKGYDAILRKTFGDYMIPVKGTAAHESPYYRKEMAVLEKHLNQLAHEDLCGNPALEMLREQEVRKREKEIGGRKAVLFCNTMTEMLCNDGSAIDKLRYVLDTFRNKEGIVLWWRPCVLDTPSARFMEEMIPCILREYRELIGEYREQGFGILDETENAARAVESCDAYYGDPGETADLFAKTGRPMMYQDYEIF